MIKICRTERSALRQKQIVDALYELLKQKRFEAITVTELCDVLNMPRKAFYRYFDSLETALEGLVELTLASYHDPFLEPPPVRSLQKEIESFFAFWYKKREFLETLDRAGQLTVVMNMSVNYPISNIISLNRLLPGEDERTQGIIYRFAITGLISTVIEWYKEGFATSIPDIARIAVRMLTKPPFPNLERLGIVDVK